MHPQSSSTSSSEPSSGAVDADVLRGALKTLAWIVAYVTVFELAIAFAPMVPRFGPKLHEYFEHGRSPEARLRVTAAIPDLPRADVFNVGWLEPSRWTDQPSDADVAIYGMSYAGNVGNALRRVRPGFNVRMIGGPGMPLSHSYTAYQLDKSQRKTRVVMISMLTSGLRDILGMTHDTLYTDQVTPVQYPRYRLEGERVVVEAQPVINSDDQLRDALLRDPALWERSLDNLEAHDVNFKRWIYASHWTEHFAIGRMVRRGYSTGRRLDFSAPLPGPKGYAPDHEASKLGRAMLRQFIQDVRANGEIPIVILFAEFGAGRSLHGLVGDVLEETHTPFVDSDAVCSSHKIANYQNLHLIHPCDDLVAAEFLKLYDQATKSDAAQSP